ncbi:MAG: zinc-ribbon domain-containing protein [Oscillospiraceae bacterium]
MYCQHCGSQIQDGVKFCANCGEPVFNMSQPTQSGQIPLSPPSPDIETVEDPSSKNMVTWKLVSGIISIAFSMVLLFQSCALGVASVFAENTEYSASTGILVAIMMLVIGIVSIATRKNRGGNIALIVLSLLTVFVGFSGAGNFTDLIIWCWWIILIGTLAIVCLIRWKNPASKINTDEIHYSSPHS